MASVDTITGYKLPINTQLLPGQNSQKYDKTTTQTLPGQQVNEIQTQTKDLQIEMKSSIEQYREAFEEMSRRMRFDRNTLVNQNISLEFGVVQRPNQMYVRIEDYRTDALLKMLPPDFLLRARVVLQTMVSDQAYQKVIEGLFVNKTG